MNYDEQKSYAAVVIDPRENRIVGALNVDPGSLESEHPGRHWSGRLAKEFRLPPERRQVIGTIESKEQLNVLTEVKDDKLTVWIADRHGDLTEAKHGLVAVRVERLLWD